MLNAVSRFEIQFQPYGDGFVAWPSSRYGGKFVTANAYEAMRAAVIRNVGDGWGYRPLWIALPAIVILAFAIPMLSGPWWAVNIGNVVVISAFTTYDYYWVKRPVWMLRGEPDILPPRSHKTAIRAQATVVGWPMLAFLLVIGLIGIWYAIDRRLATPLAIGSLLLFSAQVLAVLFLGIAKWREPSSPV